MSRIHGRGASATNCAAIGQGGQGSQGQPQTGAKLRLSAYNFGIEFERLGFI